MPDPVDLDALLAHVKDEDSFIRFIEALGDDFASGRLLDKASPPLPYGPGSLGWENLSIDAFFEAAAAWAAASSRVAQSDGPGANVWQRCARIIFAGKFYE